MFPISPLMDELEEEVLAGLTPLTFLSGLSRIIFKNNLYVLIG